MIDTSKTQARDPASRKPLTKVAPGIEATEPSPGEDEKPRGPDADEEGDDIKEQRPDQKDIPPGSDAASDDDALGVGKEDEPDTGPT
jgi:hypothetical protein